MVTARTLRTAHGTLWLVFGLCVVAAGATTVCTSALNTPVSSVLPATSGNPLHLTLTRLYGGQLSLVALTADGSVQAYDSSLLAADIDAAAAASTVLLPPTTLASGIAYPLKIVGLDWDGDGDTDLVVATQTQLLWLPNDGTPDTANFTAAGGSGAGPVSLASLATLSPTYLGAADVDGDGASELVLLASLAASPLLVCTKSPSSNSSCSTSSPPPPPPSPSFSNPSVATIADFDGDGTDDVAAAGVYDSSGVSLWLRIGSGSPPPAVLISSPAHDDYSYIASGDLDGDGIPDIVVVTTMAPVIANSVPSAFISDPASVHGGTPQPVAAGHGLVSGRGHARRRQGTPSRAHPARHTRRWKPPAGRSLQVGEGATPGCLPWRTGPTAAWVWEGTP